jgi:hypothetical protein
MMAERRRALVRLGFWWLASVAAALPFMSEPGPALLEAAIALGWLLPLVWSADVIRLVGSAPRVQVWAVGLMLTVWFHAQLRDERLSFFPFVSWYMYGAPRSAPVADTHALRGARCGDGTVALEVADILPRHGGVRIRLSAWHRDLAAARTAADSASKAARVDDLLRRLGQAYNAEHRDAPLCGLSLLRLRASLDEVRSGRLPDPVSARHVELR